MGAIVDYCYESTRRREGDNADRGNGSGPRAMEQAPHELSKVQRANRVITYWQQQDELFDQLSFQYMMSQINGHLLLQRY